LTEQQPFAVMYPSQVTLNTHDAVYAREQKGHSQQWHWPDVLCIMPPFVIFESANPKQKILSNSDVTELTTPPCWRYI